MMHAAGDDAEGVRLRGLIVVLWRAGLRVSEALALAESDLDPSRGAILVRHGKGGKRREVGMDRWAWEQLTPWLTFRSDAAGRGVVLHPARPNAGSAVGTCRRTHATSCGGSPGRGATPLRAASAAPRARGGDVARRGPAARDPAATRACRPRDHLGVSPRHRQHRDRPHRPRTPSADGPRVKPALKQAGGGRPGAARRSEAWLAAMRGVSRGGRRRPSAPPTATDVAEPCTPGESYVADPLVSSSYLQMVKAVASSIGRWRVLDA